MHGLIGRLFVAKCKHCPKKEHISAYREPIFVKKNIASPPPPNLHRTNIRKVFHTKYAFVYLNGTLILDSRAKTERFSRKFSFLHYQIAPTGTVYRL